MRLLGGFGVQQGERVLDPPASRAAAQLLALLALAPGRDHTRESLAERIWPDAPPATGRNRLRQALFALREQFEAGGAPPLFEIERNRLRARPEGLDSDVRQFEQAAQAGDTRAALALYRGELMPGHHEDWVLSERRRLAALYERLLAPAPAAGDARRSRAPQVLGLPHRLDPSFGLAPDAARLRAQIEHQRLVTVHGPGGSGKTRLAIELASSAASAGGFDRVAFVSLIDCVGADPVLEAITATLRIEGGSAAGRLLASALADGRTLLVLDNLEQIDATAEQALAALLDACPGLHLLATSRRLLGLAGEQAFERSGLALPEADASDADTWQSPAASLFVDRARAVRPGFDPGPAQWPAVRALVRLLGGMPLAIELAASRMRSLSPAELLAMLQREGGSPMLDTLARQAGRQGSDRRHGSMRHVVDWSWRQLNPPQQDLMRAMAAFGSPACLPAVAAVAQLDEDMARDLLEQLDHQSLLQALPDGRGGTRYVLQQPVREFVAERTEALVARHRRQHLRQWLIQFGRGIAARGLAALPERTAELPLLYAAVPAAVADADPEGAAALLAAFRRHWEVDTRSGLPASVAQALAAVAGTLTDTPLFVEAHLLLAYTRVLAGDADAAAAAATQALQRAPDDRLRAQALMRLAQSRMLQGPRGEGIDQQLGDALALARTAGDAETQGLVLRLQFLLATNRDGDFDRAGRLAEQAQQIWESLGHRRNAGTALMDRASVWGEQGRLDEAAIALRACEAMAREEGYATGYITATWQIGRAAIRRREANEALAAFRRCVRDAWQERRMVYVADALVLTPTGLVACGHHEAAARLLGFAVPHWISLSGAMYRQLEQEVRRTRRLLHRALGGPRLEALRLQGAGLDLPAAVQLALHAEP